MVEAFLAFLPLLVFFLSLAAAIFACKAHAQARENGEVIRELMRRVK